MGCGCERTWGCGVGGCRCEEGELRAGYGSVGLWGWAGGYRKVRCRVGFPFGGVRIVGWPS